MTGGHTSVELEVGHRSTDPNELNGDLDKNRIFGHDSPIGHWGEVFVPFTGQLMSQLRQLGVGGGILGRCGITLVLRLWHVDLGKLDGILGHGGTLLVNSGY